jgi:DNA-binding MarR family transcriptional regulator
MAAVNGDGDADTSSRWSEALVDNLFPSPAHLEHDPALLAFVKCHVTSFLRWDLLRLLANHGPSWTDAEEAARALHKPRSALEAALAELESEGLVQASRSPHGATAYRMDPLEPSTRVVERLVAAATRSHELRQIIVARVLGGARLAS